MEIFEQIYYPVELVDWCVGTPFSHVHSGRSQSAELHSLPNVPVFFKSFELLDGNVPIFSNDWKRNSSRFGCDRCAVITQPTV